MWYCNRIRALKILTSAINVDPLKQISEPISRLSHDINTVTKSGDLNTCLHLLLQY